MDEGPGARRYGPRMRSKPAITLAGCLALAALSLLLPSVPTTDPWGWIVWGRELAHGSLNTAIGGAPSWKPLPVLFTAPLSLSGSATPDLWLVAARTGGLVSLVLAYHLAARAAGCAAGVSAVLFVATTGGWTRAMAYGYSEPILDALVLAAAERHLSGSRRTALGLLAFGSLARPELFAFAGLYGLWLVVRDRRALIGVAAALLAVPALWLGGDWIGAGNPLHGGDLAKLYSNLTTTQMLQGLPTVMGWPTLALAVISLAVAVALRDRLTLALAAWALAWVALVVLLPAFGGPGSTRFLLPPAVLVCVVAGVAIGRAARIPPLRSSRFVAAAATVGVLGILPQVLGGETSAVYHSLLASRSRAHIQTDLRRIASTVVHMHVPVCGRISLPSRLGWNRGALAWEFRTGLDKVQPRPSSPDLSTRSSVRFESDAYAHRPPAPASAGSERTPSVHATSMWLPPKGAVFFMPMRDARVQVSESGFRALYTVRDGNWTAVAVCPHAGRPVGLRPRPAP